LRSPRSLKGLNATLRTLCLCAFLFVARTASADFLKVLFVGNSLTYYNEMPVIAATLSEHESRPMRIALAVRAGASLKQLWLETDARAKISKTRWDYVVIQGGAGAAGPLKQVDEFDTYLALFATEARRNGAEPLFYQVWSLKQPAEHEAASMASAKSVRARVVPAGSAWYDLIGSARFDRLDSDGVHPNALGSYLIACTIYSTIYNKSAAGAVYDFRKFAEPGQSADDALREQVISETEAHALQDAAWRAVERAKKR
jgi:hypothetical protein